MPTKQEFDAKSFYSAVDTAVRSRDVRWKDVSADTGISQTTLTRMGQGRQPDAASLAALSAWAGINPADYVSGIASTVEQPRTLEKVALLFRQDAQLSQDAARSLAEIVTTAYNALKVPEPDIVKRSKK